jgi:hypothetical protein
MISHRAEHPLGGRRLMSGPFSSRDIIAHPGLNPASPLQHEMLADVADRSEDGVIGRRPVEPRLALA